MLKWFPILMLCLVAANTAPALACDNHRVLKAVVGVFMNTEKCVNKFAEENKVTAEDMMRAVAQYPESVIVDALADVVNLRVDYHNKYSFVECAGEVGIIEALELLNRTDNN